MPVSSNAKDDRSSTLDGTPHPTVAWRVVKVQPAPDYVLNVEFVDGLAGSVHLSSLVNSADAGVFAALRDPKVFAQAFLNYGAVTWPGELDLAPDAMYDEIQAHGKWVL